MKNKDKMMAYFCLESMQPDSRQIVKIFKETQ